MSSGLTILTSTRGQKPQIDWEPIAEQPLVGKDVLELLSSSMYVNALAIYREYIQNAADAIDEARRNGLLSPHELGRVAITLDSNPDRRTVRIRDNGIGLNRSIFVPKLVAFGASGKRGSYARGFRGVGRLAGLGYCQELIFRSRSSAKEPVSELRWNCRELKALLRRQEPTYSLERTVRETVTTRTLKEASFPERFFEVELTGIVRHGNDLLLNRVAIENYLSQVAPVPFAPSFKFAKEIETLLMNSSVNLGNLEIRLDGSEEPIFRPHQNRFEARKGVVDVFREVEPLMVHGDKENVAAVGWILHHDYLGAIPVGLNIHGIRLRSGNMQIGEANVLDSIFPESRFNSWTVGEIHILDSRVLPNGRRDQFEHSVHYSTILNTLQSKAKDLAYLCRLSSLRRNRMRTFEQVIKSANDDLAVLRQGAITRSKRTRLKNDIYERIQALEKIAASSALDAGVRDSFHKRLTSLSARTSEVLVNKPQHQKLARLRSPKRRLIQKLCDLIYQNSDKQASAKSLIERILRGL